MQQRFKEVSREEIGQGRGKLEWVRMSLKEMAAWQRDSPLGLNVGRCTVMGVERLSRRTGKDEERKGCTECRGSNPHGNQQKVCCSHTGLCSLEREPNTRAMPQIGQYSEQLPVTAEVEVTRTRA